MLYKNTHNINNDIKDCHTERLENIRVCTIKQASGRHGRKNNRVTRHAEYTAKYQVTDIDHCTMSFLFFSESFDVVRIMMYHRLTRQHLAEDYMLPYEAKELHLHF
jgi:hypothetical protein